MAPVPIPLVWAAVVGVVGTGVLTGLIIGCAQIETYRFEQEGWTPPVYDTVSEMITRNALCTDTFTAWLVVMMILTGGAVVWVGSELFATRRYALASLLGTAFVVAVSGAGMVLKHPHIAESEYWEWYKSNSTDPWINPNHSGTAHDIGAGLVLGGVMAVIAVVAWASTGPGRWITIGLATTAAIMLGLLVGLHCSGYKTYHYFEYAFLYAAILTGASTGVSAGMAAKNSKTPALSKSLL